MYFVGFCVLVSPETGLEASERQKLCPLTKAQGTAQGKTRQVLFPAAPQLHATQAADL